LIGLRRALFGVAFAAVIAGAAASALVLSSDHTEMSGLAVAIGLLVSWSFVGTGLFAWWRRPSNRFGALMTAVGFTFMLDALVASDDSVVFTFGVIVSGLYFVVFAHMVLAYPEGRLERRWHAWLLGAGYFLTVVGSLPQLLWGWGPDMECDGCPESALLAGSNDSLRDALNAITSSLGVLIVAAVLVILLRRWAQATAPQRRALAPVLWSGVVLLVLLASALGSDAAGINRLGDLLGVAGLIVFASVPWVFLVGLVRSRVQRAGAVSELLLALGEAPGTGTLRCRLADALGDTSLDLVFWLEDKRKWVDYEGHVVELPPEGDPARAWTPVELEDRRVGAIVHDVTLCEEPELLRSVGAAAGLAMENERLQAQLRARVEELRASRARIVEAGTQERRRLERNLHDGAQQRLVALSLTLRLAQGKLHQDPDKANELINGAQEELTLALGELRELARGIHPAILSDRGLGAALEALAGRAPIAVQLAEVPNDPLPEAIEAAAYFVVAEALTNVVKYAHASQATVRVSQYNGHAVVEIADDGIGGADPGRGSGLRGLADRVSALDGNMQLDSPAGAGTRLRAEIPV
jgi:signal transduction histidine kinase